MTHKLLSPKIGISQAEIFRRYEVIGETLAEYGESIALEIITPKEKGEKFLQALGLKDSSLARSLPPTIIGVTLEYAFDAQTEDRLVKIFKKHLQRGSLKEAAVDFMVFYDDIFDALKKTVKVTHRLGRFDTKRQAQDILMQEHAVRRPFIRAHRFEKKNAPIDVPFKSI